MDITINAPQGAGKTNLAKQIAMWAPGSTLLQVVDVTIRSVDDYAGLWNAVGADVIIFDECVSTPMLMDKAQEAIRLYRGMHNPNAVAIYVTQQEEKCTNVSNSGGYPVYNPLTVQTISQWIKDNPGKGKHVNDGQYSFAELYENRNHLFIALCRSNPLQSWKSKKDHNGTSYYHWFILGIFTDEESQIVCRMPYEFWDDCKQITTLDKAPKWDGVPFGNILDKINKRY